MKSTPLERAGQAVIMFLLAVMCISILYPFLYMLAISLNTGADAARGAVYLWPRSFTWINYEIVLGNEVIRNAYLVTTGSTLIGTFGGLAVTLAAAYGLSYKQLPF